MHRRRDTLNTGGNLNFNVSVFLTGHFRVAGSTFPPGHPVRQNLVKIGEGLIGYFAERKIAGYAQTRSDTNSANRPVFDQFGRQIGEVPVREYLRGASPARYGQKWNYYRPIFERSTTAPWSNRIIGTFTVLSTADDADELFKTEEFHQMVDSIATEVTPYLDALQVLMGEEKL